MSSSQDIPRTEYVDPPKLDKVNLDIPALQRRADGYKVQQQIADRIHAAGLRPTSEDTSMLYTKSKANEGNVESTLASRGNVHGDFQVNALVSNNLRKVMEEGFGLSGVPLGACDPVVREGLNMILHKLARIAAGDHNFYDHWHDIAGYATLVERYVRKHK